MGKLGISIYPEKTTEKEVLDYIDKAGEAGFSRIFSCLLSANESREVILEKFRKINQHAKEKGFEIIHEELIHKIEQDNFEQTEEWNKRVDNIVNLVKQNL